MTNDIRNPEHCAQHQVQQERMEHLRERMDGKLDAAHRRMDEIEGDVTRLQTIIAGNGTEGLAMRVATVEKQIASVAGAMDKIQATLTNINRTAWGIVAMIGVTALYWAASQIVGKHQ